MDIKVSADERWHRSSKYSPRIWNSVVRTTNCTDKYIISKMELKLEIIIKFKITLDETVLMYTEILRGSI